MVSKQFYIGGTLQLFVKLKDKWEHRTWFSKNLEAYL